MTFESWLKLFIQLSKSVLRDFAGKNKLVHIEVRMQIRDSGGEKMSLFPLFSRINAQTD